MGKLLRAVRNLSVTAGAIGAAGVWYRKRAERHLSMRAQTVLVTGAGSGLGRLLARGAAQRNAAHIVVWDINEQSARDTVDEILAYGVDASYDVVDLADDESVDAAGAAVRQRIGGIDFLINNAGIVTGKTFLEQNHHDVERTYQINTLALYRVTRQFLPNMVANNFGSITVVASAASLIGVARQTDYAASKWAAHGFMESLRAEMRHYGHAIHTLSVHPFYVDTGMFDGASSPNVLLPILESETVVHKIFRAIESGKRQLILPSTAALAKWLQLLPVPVADQVSDLLGINTTMDHFTGRTTPGETQS
ncbi:SDR family oxidoreductase [Enteractinococcus coprophilus]|uniref:All-trans-retinol dehydrogenase (NAD+) n=1 Tax=Enteractinococcus coprophilus TaxID=1027633 RepID=A0A543AFQ6_9MICC|nr:SDR family oxidoreductase [Enteractinococcus coprophilus]TQL71399.1 all-trans-retinol dehydrogenase (NAD+) [Enteractinococcus coprophilus]